MKNKKSYAVAMMTGVLFSFQAQAQFAGGNGRALDANLQQGSGGVNSTLPKHNFNYGNNIVTGNVGGLSYFHGDVGYTAPGSFQGTTGSTDLFRFRAQSSLINQSSNFSVNIPKRPIYNSLQGSTVKNIQIINPTRQSGYATTSSFKTYDPMSSSLSQVNLLQFTSTKTQTILDSSGILKEFTASPLGGLRTTSSFKNYKWLSEDLMITPTLEDLIINPIENKEIKPEDQPDGPEDLMASFSHGKKFGFELTRFIQLKDIKAEDTKIADQKIQEIENDLLSKQLGNKDIKPGDDVYVDILSEIKKQYDALKAGENQAIRDIKELPTPDEKLFEDPSDSLLARARKAREDAVKNIFDIKPLGEVDEEEDPLEEKYKNLPKSMREFVTAIDLSKVELNSFASKSQKDYINQWMLKAEELMVQKDYFRAQRVYKSVLTVKPGHPLGRVGIIHAQLGAGMNRSAVLNLRKLIVDHPELLKVKYKGNVIPGKDRLEKIKKNLEKIVRISKTNDAAIALAYIGYQGSNVKLTQLGLDIAQTIDPKDTLVILLRKLWLSPGAEKRVIEQVKPMVKPAPAVVKPKPAPVKEKVNTVKPVKKVEVKPKEAVKPKKPKVNSKLLQNALDE